MLTSWKNPALSGDDVVNSSELDAPPFSNAALTKPVFLRQKNTIDPHGTFQTWTPAGSSVNEMSNE